jgi:hypothetical protein
MIIDQINRVREMAPPPREIVFSMHALKPTDERLFPVSRHRSRRILKKLIKRHGGEFRMAPAIISIGKTIYAHPAFRASLRAEMTKRAVVQNEGRNAGIEPRISGVKVYF